MSENRVKPVHHYSVRKREAREFHGSGLISNHVNFARDVEVSTITTTKAGEECNEESKIESQTLHYMDVLRRICRPILLRAIKNNVFFGEVGELAEIAPYDDSLEPLATEEEAVSQCKNGSRS